MEEDVTYTYELAKPVLPMIYPITGGIIPTKEWGMRMSNRKNHKLKYWEKEKKQKKH